MVVLSTPIVLAQLINFLSLNVLSFPVFPLPQWQKTPNPIQIYNEKRRQAESSHGCKRISRGKEDSNLF